MMQNWPLKVVVEIKYNFGSETACPRLAQLLVFVSYLWMYLILLKLISATGLLLSLLKSAVAYSCDHLIMNIILNPNHVSFVFSLTIGIKKL